LSSEAVLISVPHTGTHFTLRMLEDAGYTPLGLFEETRERRIVRYGHVLKQGQADKELELSKTRPLVVPLRHPYRVWESWRLRSKHVRDFVWCFRVIAELDAHFVPIDSGVRDAAVERLSETLGVKLEPDWSVVVNGRKGTHGLKLADCKPPREVIEFTDEMHSMISRFY